MCRILLVALIGLSFCGLTNVSLAQTPRTDSPEVLKALLALPAPTPRHAGTPEPAEQNEWPPDFFEEKNVPPDDAPLLDLVAYWIRWSSEYEYPGLTDTVRRRLLDYSVSEPQVLSHFLRLFPQNEDTHKKVKELYDAAENNEQFDKEWRGTVKEWLLYNSKYYLDELLTLARKAKDDKDGNVHKGEALIALAKLDWSNAEPLLRNLLASGQPRSSALALSLFYGHAIDEKDMSGEDRYRRDLMSIASNQSQPGYARDAAIRALAATKWSGRDEWYMALLQDGSLLELSEDGFTYSPLTEVFESDVEKWIPVMVRLLESKDINIRSAAASCLLTFQGSNARKDALTPLLPWLSNPAWLKDASNGRLRLIQSLEHIDLPESVPGLIAVVEMNDDDNRYERSYAAKSLARYKDPRAVPALKKALAKERNENQREHIIEGLVACRGLTESEQLEALEAYAAKLTTEESRTEMLRPRLSTEEPLPIQLSIGRYFTTISDVPESLVNAVLVRADNLKAENPELAKELLQIAQEWQSNNVDFDMIRRIANGSADAKTIEKAFQRKPKFGESLRPSLQGLSAASGAAQGVGAVLLDDGGLAEGILTSRDQPAQIGLLACARLTQMPLPVELVGRLLKSKNSLVAFAAETYLLAEDSREARQLLWQHHPNEAFVTGWREPIYSSDQHVVMVEKIEKELRAELFKENGPTEILAMLGFEEEPRMVLRIYGDKAVFTEYEDKSRYRERTVSPAQLSALRDYLTTKNVADRGPTIDFCHHGCPPSEFLTLTKEKGRRIYNHVGYGEWPEIHNNFKALGAGDDAKIHYNLEKDINGLEVLFAGDGLAVHDISKQGSEWRVLVEREPTEEETKERDNLSMTADSDEELALLKERYQRYAEQDRARVTWRVFTNRQPGAVTSRPDHYTNFDGNRFLVEDSYDVFYASDPQVQVLNPNSIVIARNFSGLWKQDAGAKAVQLSTEGGYSNPVATPDGKWVVVSKADLHGAATPSYIVRYNLQTGREFRVRIDPANEFNPIAFVAPHNKVLLHREKSAPSPYLLHPAGPDKPEDYLLDPSTGETRLVTGEFEPLRQRGSRALQRTEKPDEFWTAIPDKEKNRTRVGRYNARDFSFKLVMEVPHIVFDSFAMWVEANEGKVYLVYKGQVLRLPLQERE